MTNCKIVKVNGIVRNVSVEGHANSATFGRDIICATISAFTQFLAFGCVNVANLQDSLMNLDPNGQFQLELTEEEALQVKLLSDTFVNVMVVLESQHENYMKVEVLENESD